MSLPNAQQVVFLQFQDDFRECRNQVSPENPHSSVLSLSSTTATTHAIRHELEPFGAPKGSDLELVLKLFEATLFHIIGAEHQQDSIGLPAERLLPD